MASIYTDTPKIGVDLLNKIDAADTKRRSGHNLGSQVFGSDGKRYVYAQADDTIAASTTTADVSVTTFLADATGGTYKSPPVAMSKGDRGWFGKPSV